MTWITWGWTTPLPAGMCWVIAQGPGTSRRARAVPVSSFVGLSATMKAEQGDCRPAFTVCSHRQHQSLSILFRSLGA